MARVVVLGGGVAGLSAAHELAERGFEVVLVEKTGIPGGKARSKPVMPSGPSPWSDLPRFPSAAPSDPVPWVPGEHGFRFFPGFYKHVIDTMARIPTPTGQSAAEHLVPAAHCGYAQYDRATFKIPARFPRTPGDLGTVLTALVAALSPVTELTREDLAHFGGRIWQILTSCSERRLEEYEKISWWEYVNAESRSPAFQKFLAIGFTRSMVAAHATTASTRTIGNIFIQLLIDVLDPLISTADRLLDGPTNQTWIYPWLIHLRNMGVTYLRETEVTEIRYQGGRITGVLVRNGKHTEEIRGDYYICALPAEQAARLLTPEILRADPSLAGIRTLAAECLEWMNGVQYYMRRPVPMIRGHMIHIDTEWALTSISQVDFWRPGTMSRYGPRNIEGIISVDISDWDSPAPNGRTATQHTREEVCVETWRQLKRSVNVEGKEILRDEDLAGWYLDSCVGPDPEHPDHLVSGEPLLVNLVDSWKLRPEAVTAIPNFLLAADYVRTHTDLATMEAANEAARRAVNGILDAEAFSGSRCKVWPLHEPPSLAPLRQYDAMRFGLGLPWDASMMNFASAVLEVVDPLLAPIPELLTAVQPFVADAQTAIEAVESRLPMQAMESAVDPLVQRVQAAVESAEAALPLAEMESAILEAARSHIGAAPAKDRRVPVPMDEEETVGPLRFNERMEWYRSLTLATLGQGVPQAEPRQYLYEPIREFVQRPSKGLRPGLCIATCRAYGGRASDALPFAAGIELLHNAFLVHDDIEDGSEFRRGRPTLHRTLGMPLAVNIGDAMDALSMRLFRQSINRFGPEGAVRIFDEVDHMLMESLEGQAMELGWVRDNNCSVGTDDYMRLVLKKTAWYSFIHPMRIGAIVARPNEGELERFHAFGFLLGAAFQIQDDVLNLVGDVTLYGKEIGGDLWEGKRTLPLIHAFCRTTAAERARLEDFFARPRERRLTRQLYEVQRVLEGSGSIEWARGVARALAHSAKEALPVAFAGAQEGPDLSFVRSLVDYLIEREV